MKSKKITLQELVDTYFKSTKYLDLSGKSQKDYHRELIKVCDTKVKNSDLTLGDLKADKITMYNLMFYYDVWLLSGTRTANYRVSCLSVVYRQGILKGLVTTNPIIGLPKKKEKPRKIKWKKEQVKAFLDVAYGEFKWRSIGLIVHMSYEWGQRVGDMRNLKWSDLNLTVGRLDLTQSKRGADVHLPITKNLTKMLTQQKEDFGFQDHVAPRVKPRTGSYTPYDMLEIKDLVNDVKKVAGLPKEITAMDLRRTAITEMAESGVDMAGIMQVSGHANPQSVKPYLVNTFSGASKALDTRFGETND